MPGRIPNAVDNKAHRVKPPVPPQKLGPNPGVEVPMLPKTFKWTAKGKRYWQKIWESPMAVTYIDADLPGLERMTMLVEIISTGDITQGILSELRQLEDRFGLSPLARRRLQWDIDKANGLHNPPVEPDEPKDDERFLRVVSSD